MIALVALLAVVGCGGGSDSSSSTGGGESASADSNASPESSSGAGTDSSKKPKVTVPGGSPPTQLKIIEIKEGAGGPKAKAGDEVTVQYVGVGYESEEEFDSSWSRNEPFSFQLGAGMVIPGWEQGIKGMKAGGRRELIIPPELAYGEAGSPPAIGPNETLIFVVDLLAVE